MSERPLNAAEIQKDHAVVHFFALLAGIEDVDVRARLLVSGLAFFLHLDVAVLGFETGVGGAFNTHVWQNGGNSQSGGTMTDAASIEAAVRGCLDELGYEHRRILSLIYLGRIIGYVGLARRGPLVLPPEEEFLLSSLQSLTAHLLANQIERKRAEAAINRRNRTLAGISTIFREALKCETEEELGQTCLGVAADITGSQFGFIGEIGTDGLLHDIAISDPGWELCAMQDKTGHRRPLGNFKIRGLYGQVLQEGKSLLTNAPAEHPDSLGVPSGHPLLTAFLGVPLLDGSRVVGMVALGNRAGGYHQEELETVEALAPAILEALQRKRTELALVRSEKLVSVGRLAATIAHEINNPLEAATNALYLVSQDASISGQAHTMANLAEQELRRAAQIARRTLGFYRQPNSRTAVSVTELFADLAALYEPRLKDLSIQFRVRCADESAAVMANAGEMRQLFSNLLANSIDAVGKGGTVEVRVSRTCSGTGAPLLRILVADSGAGIEPQHVKRIFEPFFTTKRDVGTGLGLWIGEQIVKKHGGTLRVRSRVGQGTVFAVTLPAPPTAVAAAVRS